MYKKTSHKKRYQRTFSFLKTHISKESKILDLGVENPFSKFLKSKGFKIENTNGEDLDEDLSAVLDTDADVITAFEILEHLLSPYVLLKKIKAKKLLISVPLKLAGQLLPLTNGPTQQKKLESEHCLGFLCLGTTLFTRKKEIRLF